MNTLNPQTSPISFALIALVAGALIAGAAGGFFAAQYFIEPEQIEPGNEYIKEEHLPIAGNILENPAIYEWWGSVEGEVVAKTNSSFTLQRGDASVTVKFWPQSTKFVRRFESTFIEYEDLEVGTLLRGSVILTPRDRSSFTGVRGDIVGSTFYTIDELSN